VQFPAFVPPHTFGRLLLMWASRFASSINVGLRMILACGPDDWDGLLHRRVIRLLVRYSRTLFFQ